MNFHQVNAFENNNSQNGVMPGKQILLENIPSWLLGSANDYICDLVGT